MRFSFGAHGFLIAVLEVTLDGPEAVVGFITVELRPLPEDPAQLANPTVNLQNHDNTTMNDEAYKLTSEL